MVLQKKTLRIINSKQFAVKFGQARFSDRQVDFCSLLVRGQVENFGISTPLLIYFSSLCLREAKVSDKYEEG